MAIADEAPGRTRALRPKQEVVMSGWRMEFKGSRFLDKQSLTHFRAPFATIKSGIWLSRYHCLDWCKIGPGCFKESFLGIVEVFERQIPNEDMDIEGEADGQPA